MIFRRRTQPPSVAALTARGGAGITGWRALICAVLLIGVGVQCWARVVISPSTEEELKQESEYKQLWARSWEEFTKLAPSLNQCAPGGTKSGCHEVSTKVSAVLIDVAENLRRAIVPRRYVKAHEEILVSDPHDLVHVL